MQQLSTRISRIHVLYRALLRHEHVACLYQARVTAPMFVQRRRNHETRSYLVFEQHAVFLRCNQKMVAAAAMTPSLILKLIIEPSLTILCAAFALFAAFGAALLHR